MADGVVDRARATDRVFCKRPPEIPNSTGTRAPAICYFIDQRCIGKDDEACCKKLDENRPFGNICLGLIISVLPFFFIRMSWGRALCL